MNILYTLCTDHQFNPVTALEIADVRKAFGLESPMRRFFYFSPFFPRGLGLEV